MSRPDDLRPVDRQLEPSDELVALRAFLQAQRDAIVASVAGLSSAELGDRRVSSLTTLAGLVQHLTDVEPWWFCTQFDGQEDRMYAWQVDGDANWRVADDVDAEGLVAAYRAACSASDAVLDRATSLEEVARGPVGRRGAPPNLRWVLLHMIEETARHAGHADILREQVLADR